jgi:flagellar protein FlaF
MQMYRTKYDDARLDCGQDARWREQQALSRGIELLHGLGERGLGEHGASMSQRIEALLYIRRLWTLFIEDLARPDNGLPEALRAELISIGIWVIKEADVIRHNKTGDLETLITVNTAMRDALK